MDRISSEFVSSFSNDLTLSLSLHIPSSGAKLKSFSRCGHRYLNPQGIIPPSAVFKKGENNEKPRAQGQETSTSSNATTTTTGGEKATTTGGIDVEDMAAPSDDEEDLKGGEEMEG